MTPEEITACVNAAFPLPSILFVIGALTLAAYLKRKYQLTLAQTFKAMVGVEKVRRTKASAIIMMLTLLVPLGLWLVLGQRCG